jgi:hypothetical protein
MSDMKPEAVKNAEVNDAERAVVKRLVEEANKWQSAAPHGLDFVMERLARLVRHIDSTLVEKFPQMDIPAQRVEAVALMHAYLNKPPVIPNVSRTQARRRKLQGGKKEVANSAAYDTKTMRLLADDWPAWLEEVELGGFLKSIAGLVQEYDKSVKEYKQDDVEPEKLHFLLSFDLRRKFGKVEPELIEALDFLGKMEAMKPAAKKSKAKATA